ncbi:MAG: STAS/SEC14 domain-containing protein [Alphaproteobacteria bacterium]
MSTTKNKKFNTIMPQTTDRVLCIEIDKLITAEGYAQNFLPKLKSMIEKHGELRLLINYKEFKGWEKNAAQMDLETSAKHAKNLKKLALINAPEKEIFQKTLKKDIMGGDVKFFKNTEFDKALEWVSN